jgi:hypothetical protein
VLLPSRGCNNIPCVRCPPSPFPWQVAPADPGANGWLPSPPYPLTMLGPPALGGGDYSVTAVVRFSSAAPTSSAAAAARTAEQGTAVAPLAAPHHLNTGVPFASPARDGLAAVRAPSRQRPTPALGSRGLTGAYAMPCEANAAAEVFAWNGSTDGYISSSFGGSEGCLTTCGCEANCIQFWECGQGGCGSPGQSYEWIMPAGGGALANAAYAPGGVLTFAGGVLSIANDTGSDGQVWAFDPSSGQFSLPRLGLCLSAEPIAGDAVFAQACVRASGPWPWTAPMPGYCLQVLANGTWALLAGDGMLAQGTVSPPFNATLPHALTVRAARTTITAFLDGTRLANVTDEQFASGSAAIGGGWHFVAVDNIMLEAAS